ncbi:MAG TPA: polyprenyl synthetase family protein [Kofleriaceae bacterium]|nr:polyprenyl synthetase family protein [Kofleriaceae bacterium]
MALVQTAVPATANPRSNPSLLSRLGAVVGPRGAEALADRLRDLEAWVAADLRGFEAELAGFERGTSLVQRSAHHLLDLDGKHVRPLCVLLAARAGSGFSDAARQLALAVELAHSATLLHDDVVDLGETRRGAPTARVVYGNAASIFAGDWLLIESLRRVRYAGVAGLLDRMLDVIEEMILAESIQLENRGVVNAALADYFRVVEGKTASLFRWAMRAGATAGGLPEAACDALERYGHHLGIAFQAVDDLLDVDGDRAVTGKALFTDLREGKMTYPLIVALERSPGLVPVVAECAALAPEEPLPPAVVERVLHALKTTGAVADCRALARRHAEEAAAALSAVPDGPGVAALVTVAETTAMRDR